MSHEILLVLAGNISPLVTTSVVKGLEKSWHRALHTAERQLLNQFADCGRLFSSIDERVKATTYATSALSKREAGVSVAFTPCCQAVVEVLERRVVRQYLTELADLEKRLLGGDVNYTSTGGAAETIPLSQIQLKITSPWTRRLEYTHELLDFFYFSDLSEADRAAVDAEDPSTFPFVSGSTIYERLQSDAQVGYPDLQNLVQECIVALEKCWLRQFSRWLLYGKLPSSFSAAHDFMVLPVADLDQDEVTAEYEIVKGSFLHPISEQSTNDALSVGMLIAQASNNNDTDMLKSVGKLAKSISEHSEKTMTFPMKTLAIEELIRYTKKQVYSNLLDSILPTAQVQKLLALFRGIYLLGDGEFSMVFLDELEKKKNGSIAFTTALNYLIDEKHNESLASVPKYLSYKKSSSYTSAFSDFVTGNHYKLRYRLRWPVTIIVSPSVMPSLSAIFDMLLAIRKTILQLNDLWRQRRIHYSRSRASDFILWESLAFVYYFLESYWAHIQADLIDLRFEKLLNVAQGQVNDNHDSDILADISDELESFAYGLYDLLNLNNREIVNTLGQFLIACTQIYAEVSRTFKDQEDISIDTDKLSHVKVLALQLLSMFSEVQQERLALGEAAVGVDELLVKFSDYR
ncbi:Spindle pole body component [Yarrowia sp. B02]|nr:Spindle pole body component [Yarrowia sp. B02]